VFVVAEYPVAAIAVCSVQSPLSPIVTVVLTATCKQLVVQCEIFFNARVGGRLKGAVPLKSKPSMRASAKSVCSQS
jgi:hypothetical protein